MVKLWDINSGKLVRQYGRLESLISTVNFVAKGQIIISTFWDCTVRIFNLRTGQLVREKYDKERVLFSLAISPNERVFAAYSTLIRLWDLNTGKKLRTSRGATS